VIERIRQGLEHGGTQRRVNYLGIVGGKNGVQEGKKERADGKGEKGGGKGEFNRLLKWSGKG